MNLIDNKDHPYMKEYVRSKYVLSVEEKMELHAFFSPKIISRGLTHTEVRLCITLYPLRRKQVEFFQRKHGRWFDITSLFPLAPDIMMQLPVFPPPLPQEFDPQVVMDRERFKIGIHKFVEEAIKCLRSANL